MAPSTSLSALTFYKKMNLFRDDPVTRKAKKRLDEYFDGRKQLTHKEFHELFFKKDEFQEEVISKVLDIFENQLEYDFSRLNDVDDFSRELSTMWDIDSLADVEIVIALEEEFGIKITEQEAHSMSTIRKIVEVLHKKLKIEPDQRDNPSTTGQ